MPSEQYTKRRPENTETARQTAPVLPHQMTVALALRKTYPPFLLNFAHRLRCAAAIRARPAAEITRLCLTDAGPRHFGLSTITRHSFETSPTACAAPPPSEHGQPLRLRASACSRAAHCIDSQRALLLNHSDLRFGVDSRNCVPRRIPTRSSFTTAWSKAIRR